MKSVWIKPQVILFLLILSGLLTLILPMGSANVTISNYFQQLDSDPKS